MIVAVTGHRPPKLGSYYTPNRVYDAVKAGLLRKFRELQPTVVLTGMALGTDQWAAEVCHDNGIPFDAIVPFIGFERQWPEASQAQYRRLLGWARNTHIVTQTETYSSGLLQRRNQWLVDHSTMLLAVWNGSSGGTANCLTYARGRGKSIVFVDLPDAIWGDAAQTEMATTSRRADLQERSMARRAQQHLPPAPPTAPPVPMFRRRGRQPVADDELIDIYNEVLGVDLASPAPGTGAASIASAMRNENVQRHLLMNILHHSAPPEQEPIPSPIKGDKQATPRKTGRIIDLDD